MDRTNVMQLFARQHWVASARQLDALGVSPTMLYHARRKGVVETIARGVVAVAAAELDFEGRAMAIHLAAGSESFISGTSAGVLHGLRSMPQTPVEVTVREDHRAALPRWARLVRTSWIGEGDVVERPSGLRVAAPLRMLFGLARRFNQHRFERAAEDVWHLGLASPQEAAAYLDEIRRPGRGGVARFDEWLGKTLARARPSQSGLELDFVALVERAGLPAPERQFPLVLPSGETIHIDLAWPAARLGVEPGHSWWHGGDAAMRNDAARDRACDEVGWRIVRYDETARRDPAATTRQLRTIYHERATLFSARPV